MKADSAPLKWPRLLEIVIGLISHQKPGSIDIERILDLQTMTESFYYFAHRALKVFRQVPQLRNIEAKGITFVRNKLLDHSDGSDSGVLEVTFMIFPWTGPVIKGARAAGTAHIFPDDGLWANVNEFSEALISLLTPLVE